MAPLAHFSSYALAIGRRLRAGARMFEPAAMRARLLAAADFFSRQGPPSAARLHREQASRETAFSDWKALSGFPRRGWARRADVGGAMAQGVDRVLSDTDFPWADPASVEDLRVCAAAMARACSAPANGHTELGTALMATYCLRAAEGKPGPFEAELRLALDLAEPGWHDLPLPVNHVTNLLLAGADFEQDLLRARGSHRAFLEARALQSPAPAEATSAAAAKDRPRL